MNFFEVRRAWDFFLGEHKEYKVLHSHVRSYASIYFSVAKKHGLKTIIHSHNMGNGRGCYIQKFGKSVLQYFLRYQADYFFACSKEAGDWLFGNDVVKSSRYFTLFNAIDLKKYCFNRSVRDMYREKLRLGNVLTFIHIGRFDEVKNHKFLIEIFAKIKQKHKDAKLVLVGDGELREDIETKIMKLNMAKDVLLLGVRTDVPELLQESDCFLFPSKYEGLGIAALEAQVIGLPCICSSNVPKAVMVSDMCFFVELNDLKKWEDVIESVVNKRGRLLQNVDEYDIRKSAKWIEGFYQNILK